MGASPKMPPVPGIDLKGITTLQSMPDADFLRKVRDEGKIKKAVVLGGGLIGIETCEELPKDKDTEIITCCKISLRGYEAARTLIANGFTNVKVMEGGIMAWPYHREK